MKNQHGAQKASLVYVQAEREFLQVRGQEDWQQLLRLAADDAREDIEKKTRHETPAEPNNELPLFGPDLNSVGLA